MARLITQFKESDFDWKLSNGSADVSDLRALGPICKRIWNDACDVGFGLTSGAIFVLEEQKHDNGDIKSWRFIELEGARKITIWND